MAKPKKEPKAVKALIDKHVVQGQLQRQGLLRRLFGPAQLPGSGTGGTRQQGKHRRD